MILASASQWPRVVSDRGPTRRRDFEASSAKASSKFSPSSSPNYLFAVLTPNHHLLFSPRCPQRSSRSPSSATLAQTSRETQTEVRRQVRIVSQSPQLYVLSFAHPDFALFIDYFLNLFETLLPSHTSINPSKFDVVRSVLPSDQDLSTLDALIISGGFEDDADSDLPWVVALGEFVVRVSREYPKIKVVGICFGMQLMGKVFGGQAGRNPAGL